MSSSRTRIGSKEISLRQAFGQALVRWGAKYPRVVVLDGDLAQGTCTSYFRDAFPDRFFQCGVAEQNMMGVAAGMATFGLIPFATTFAVFASLRALEHIRDLVSYGDLNVKIVGGHVGVDTGPDGVSHQAIEDINIFRALPNFVILSPGDGIEMEQAVLAAIEHNGPVYIRSGRSPIPILYDENYEFRIGKGVILRHGTDVAVLATGIMVHRALEAADKLQSEGISVAVADLSTLKPIDRELVVSLAEKTDAIVTAEDHSIFGGLGSAVAEVLAIERPTKMRMIALADCFGESGEPQSLASKYGLTAEHIASAVKQLIGGK